MTSHTTTSFWKLYRALPKTVQRQAKSAFRKFQQEPFQSGLQFKQVHETLPVYSARINRDFRCVGIRHTEKIVWYWIGSHSDYEKLLSKI